MAHEVMCRVCRERFDTDKLPSDMWVRTNKTWYYHKKCYDDWISNKDNIKLDIDSQGFWYDSLIDYLYRDIKMEIDFKKIGSQWKNFTSPDRKPRMTAKGIYFATRYYYDVIHGNVEKALGGIGIIPSIYNEAAQYWVDLENKKTGTLNAIIEQIKEREARPVIEIKNNQTKPKNKNRWTLDEV